MIKMIELYNDDCSNIFKNVPNNFINLILTDIPYEISRNNNFKNMGRKGIDFGNWDNNFDINILRNLEPLLSKDGSIVIFHAFEQYSKLLEIFSSRGLIPKDRLIWQKTNPMPRNRDRRYISNIEMFSWFTRPNAKWTFNRQNEKYQKSVFNYPSESGGGFKRYHPTQKSLNLIVELIKIHSNKEDIILDCFMGSGTTGVACKQLNRSFIGIELDKGYFNIAKKRIENFEKEIEYKNLNLF